MVLLRQQCLPVVRSIDKVHPFAAELLSSGVLALAHHLLLALLARVVPRRILAELVALRFHVVQVLYVRLRVDHRDDFFPLGRHFLLLLNDFRQRFFLQQL